MRSRARPLPPPEHQAKGVLDLLRHSGRLDLPHRPVLFGGLWRQKDLLGLGRFYRVSVSAYNRGCMWHVSAPHRPLSAIERDIVCMRMPGLADLRQPISRGFCTQLQAVAPPAFFTRAAVDAVRWWSWRSHGASAERLRTLLTATGRPGRVSCG